MSGGLLAVSEMPQVAASSLVVPLEVNGEPALGLIATGTAEAVVDSGGEPTWLSLRFGSRVDVYLPTDAMPKVGPGDKVSATTTVLAVYRS